MSPPPLLLVRNRLVCAHGSALGLPADPQERHVQAKALGALLQQLLDPADNAVGAPADATSVVLHCLLPTLHLDHPSILAGLVVLCQNCHGDAVGCWGPVMPWLGASLSES